MEHLWLERESILVLHHLRHQHQGLVLEVLQTRMDQDHKRQLHINHINKNLNLKLNLTLNHLN